MVGRRQGQSERSPATVYDCGDIDPWASHSVRDGGPAINAMFIAGFLILMLGFLPFYGLTRWAGIDPWNRLCLILVAMMLVGVIAMLMGVAKRVMRTVRSLGPNF